MRQVKFSKIGWTLGLFFVALYLICLVWQALLADPALKTLHEQLLSLTFPGFSWLSLGSFVWGAVLSFAYGWIGAAIFAWLSRLCCGEKH
jgi:hypothetical protein